MGLRLIVRGLSGRGRLGRSGVAVSDPWGEDGQWVISGEKAPSGVRSTSRLPGVCGCASLTRSSRILENWGRCLSEPSPNGEADSDGWKPFEILCTGGWREPHVIFAHHTCCSCLQFRQ